MIENDEDFKVTKIFYKYLKENHQTYRFLKIIELASLTMIERLDGELPVDQVNSAL
jgi:hypothetical protein